MRWFKCPDPKMRSMLEAKAALGDAGLWQIACLVDEAQQQGVWDVDAELIAGWIRVKRDRAEKILPFAQKILKETAEILSKSQKNLSKSQEIFSKSEDFTPSKPDSDIAPIEKKRKEEKKTEKKNTPLTPKGESEAFEIFWMEYPRKQSKPEALRKWLTKQLDPRLDEVMAGLKAYKASEQWLRDDGKFIPHPATFLSQERWKDEVKPSASKNPNGKSERVRAILEADDLEINPISKDGPTGDTFWISGKELRFDDPANCFIWGERRFHFDEISIVNGRN